MDKYKGVEIDTIEHLRQLIADATSVGQMNDLRYASVKFMNSGHPEILKEWQSKYWTLKRCPTCGKLRR